MMLFELLILSPIGAALICCGLLIWKKTRIDLIHSYHFKRVAEENKLAYSAAMGKGILLMGIGVLLTGLINYTTGAAFGWICFAIFFIFGLILVLRAQRNSTRAFLAIPTSLLKMLSCV